MHLQLVLGSRIKMSNTYVSHKYIFAMYIFYFSKNVIDKRTDVIHAFD